MAEQICLQSDVDQEDRAKLASVSTWDAGSRSLTFLETQLRQYLRHYCLLKLPDNLRTTSR